MFDIRCIEMDAIEPITFSAGGWTMIVWVPLDSIRVTVLTPSG
jgi:hypothetical protein